MIRFFSSGRVYPRPPDTGEQLLNRFLGIFLKATDRKTALMLALSRSQLLFGHARLGVGFVVLGLIVAGLVP